MCAAQQTRPKKAEANKKSAKLKNQEERKASANLLALQEHIPTMWEHGPKNRSENRSSAVQSKPDRKKATSSQASKQRSGKNSPKKRRQQTAEKQSKTLKKHFVSTQKRTSKTTQDARPSPTQRATPPPGAKTPPTTPPQRTPKTPTPNFGISSRTRPWNTLSLLSYLNNPNSKISGQ